MAVYGMVVAQLLFGEEDRVWHMISTSRFTGGEKRMHAGPDERVEMVMAPVLRWADAATAAALLEVDDPWQAIQQQQALQQGEMARRAREFLQHWLTKRERELVMLLVQTGLDNAGLARRLGKSERTVANQLTSIYRKFEEWQGTSGSGVGTRGVLVAALRPYGEVVAYTEGQVTLRVPQKEAAAVTNRLLADFPIHDLTIHDPPIEAVIEQVFSEGERREE